jgi:hypothetical protein
MTPTKKLRKKKDPMRINTTKKNDAGGFASITGPPSSALASIACHMISGHPSKLLMINSVIIACGTSSKLLSNFYHVPFPAVHSSCCVLIYMSIEQ